MRIPCYELKYGKTNSGRIVEIDPPKGGPVIFNAPAASHSAAPRVRKAHASHAQPIRAHVARPLRQCLLSFLYASKHTYMLFCCCVYRPRDARALSTQPIHGDWVKIAYRWRSFDKRKQKDQRFQCRRYRYRPATQNEPLTNRLFPSGLPYSLVAI